MKHERSGPTTHARHQACALLAALLTTALSRHASGLDFRSSDACADRERLLAQVQRLVGRSLEASDTAGFSIEISHGDSWRLLLTTAERETAEPRRRSVEARTCKEIVSAAALVIAMAIRANDTTVPSERPPSSEHPAVERPPGPAPEPSPRAHRSATPAPLLMGVTVLGVGDAGALPRTAPGLELAAFVGSRDVRVVALGAYFPSQMAQGRGEKHATIGLLFGGVTGCFTRKMRDSVFLACAGVELGALPGEGFGVSDPARGSATWVAPRLDLGIRVALTPVVGIAVRVGGAVPLVRREFVLDNEVLHRSGAISGRAGIGLEFLL